MRILRSLAGAIAIVAACSSGSMMSGTDVTRYGQLAADLSGAVATYRTTALSMQTSAECTAAFQQYMGRARPDLDGMGPLAGKMDQEMKAMDQTTSGDTRCGMSVMAGELDRHAAAACTATDMGMNRAEVNRHGDATELFAEHMRMRSAEANGMMGYSRGSGGMMGGGTGPFMMDGGWTKPDGGMMGWSHVIPGCTFADGGFTMMDGGTP